MYLAGVSTRRIEGRPARCQWGAGVSAGTVSNLNDKAFKAVGVAVQALACEYPYVYVDGIYLKRSWGGSTTRTSPSWSPSA